jgi:hypothetical protein
MLIYPEGRDSALSSALIIRSVLRSDLVPIPQNVELELRDTPETRLIKEGGIVKVGRQEAEFIVVKNAPSGDTGKTSNNQPVRTRKIVGLLASCASVAKRAQKSTIRYGASLGEIYRACGAQLKIDSDFTVPVFACYKGMTPSFEIAKALQEEAGALVMTRGRIEFRRLAELVKAEPIATLREDSTEAVESEFLEQHLVPFAFSTGDDGAFLSGRAEGGHGVLYRPRADVRILNNLGLALIMRRVVQSDFAPHIMAGHRFDVAGTAYVVITAAHCYTGGADGDGGEQYTRLWLGEVRK